MTGHHPELVQAICQFQSISYFFIILFSIILTSIFKTEQVGLPISLYSDDHNLCWAPAICRNFTQSLTDNTGFKYVMTVLLKIHAYTPFMIKLLSHLTPYNVYS